MIPLQPLLCTALLLLLTTAPLRAAESEKDGPLLQVFLGVMKPDNQSGKWNGTPADKVDVDFSSLPSGGIEAEYNFGGGWVHWGLNPGGSIAWKNKDTTFSGSLTSENGGILVVEADNDFFLAELHLGAYVRGRLAERVTTYAAAGPMLMYGSHEIKNETVEELPPQATPYGTAVFTKSDSSDTNIGYYARAGVDFQTGEGQHIGLGVRYMSAELDFNNTVGKIDIKGPQYVLTFTTQL